MSQFLHNNANAKTIAIPLVFSENSLAKNEGLSGKRISFAFTLIQNEHIS